jgi:hypothetical protein
LGITDKDDIRFTQLLVTRFWFARLIPHDFSVMAVNPGLQHYLEGLRRETVRKVAPSKLELFHSDLSPLDFIQAAPVLGQALGILFDCMFKYSPDDYAYAVHLIQLRFMGFAANAMNRTIDDKLTSDAVRLLWRLLLIATDVPIIDKIFQLIEDRMRLAVYQGDIFANTLCAQGVMRVS